MSSPSAHRARSHRTVLADLLASARRAFGGAWRPENEETQEDLGRGLLDACALALHVLWTYEEAWADEGFLPSAELDESVDRLLAHLGYSPSPGTAALGLQHFRCRAGMTATLPAGFGIRSPARGIDPEVVFETLDVARLHPDLNEARAFLPPVAGQIIPAPPPVLFDSEDAGDGSGGTSSTSVADGLARALDGLRAGGSAALKAARARQDERRLSDMVAAYQRNGGTSAGCQDTMKAVCKDLQEAKAQLAAQDAKASPVPRRLSESQEILARQLRVLKLRNAGAAGSLDRALAKGEDESDADHAERLQAMATFLDAFVTSMVQDARDQVVLYHGLDALGRIDRAFGPSAGSAMGTALPGCDSLYLFGGGPSPDTVRTLPWIRPGDWLVLGEDIETVDALGRPSTRRMYREAVRVVRTAEVTPPGLGALHTRVVFAPALRSAYNLSRTVVLGNMVRVSHGATVEQVLPEDSLPSGGRARVALTQDPLTYLRDPRAATGKKPTVRVFAGEREWTRADGLLSAGPNDHVFVVERTPGGGARVRFGDGVRGARPPAGDELRLRYRIGLGKQGNRDAFALDAPVSAHPAIESTWNPLPTVGGTDPEPRTIARARGPLVASAMDRAVSLDDVRALVLSYGGILRASVFREGTPRRSRVTVVVAGERGLAPDSDAIAALRAHLAARVPPGVDITVVPYTLVAVRARLLLRTKAGADPIEVLRRARLALGLDREDGAPPGLLDPDRVELGDDLALSQIYRALDGVPDLVACLVQSFHREGQEGLVDRIVSGPREMLAWAPSTSDGDGVVIGHEEAVDS